MRLQVQLQWERDQAAVHNRQMDRLQEMQRATAINTQIRTGYGYSPGNRFARQDSGMAGPEALEMPA